MRSKFLCELQVELVTVDPVLKGERYHDLPHSINEEMCDSISCLA